MIWDEPIATQDLDVVILVPDEAHPLAPLRPVLDWLAKNGIALEGEHAIIGGVPVRFLPAWHPLITEGVREAATVPYNGTTIRVLRPAYLAASWSLDPAADTFRRRERTARLIESGQVTREDIDALVTRFRP